MHCVECSRKKNPGEQGWVTVLAQSRALRINYCPECIAEIVEGAYSMCLPDDGDGDDE